MHGSEFLATYPAKLMEYSLAVTYLVLFAMFWKYVMGGRKAPSLRHAQITPTRLEDDAAALAALLAAGTRPVRDTPRADGAAPPPFTPPPAAPARRTP